jgi:hypothetical protein
MRLLKLCAKCSDLCGISFQNGTGKIHESDGYVPENINIGGGDYVELDIDMETGQIQNWKPVTDAAIILSIKTA